MQFQSTHPVWGATVSERLHGYLHRISIHAPRVGCDQDPSSVCHSGSMISIHAPRVGCDAVSARGDDKQQQFQSTHPVWGATMEIQRRVFCFSNFNPRTPCGVRPHSNLYRNRDKSISIHSPRVGCDSSSGSHQSEHRDFNPRTPCGVRPMRLHISMLSARFQSTHPVWGATDGWDAIAGFSDISIHAPRVGCDP